MRRDSTTARRLLIKAAQRGGINLVLGAGVSIPRGIPNWNDLAKSVWNDVMKDKSGPWARGNRGSSPKDLPQFLPIVFERVYRKLQNDSRFLEILKKRLYARAKFPWRDPAFHRSNEVLAVLARLIAAEHKRGARRRIQSIITFNADDFIEQAISCAAGAGESFLPSEIAGAITRSTHRVLPPTAVPIYHVHGFLPSDLWGPDLGVERMLVFTDSQYWSTSANASSFANRVVNTALSEGVCFFIGLSMKDINLLRWLALRTLERDRDQLDFVKARWLKWLVDRKPETDSDNLDAVQEFLTAGSMRTPGLDRTFNRHFWIRPPGTDPSRFLSDFLHDRGVSSVDIDDWDGPSFRRLISGCFPRTSKKA